MDRIAGRMRHQDGAAAVEFALIAGVLAMLIFGMLQFGLVFFEVQNLRAATREGARIGAVGASVSDIQQRVAAASYNSVNANNVAVTPCPTTPGLLSSVRVEINVNPSNTALPPRLRSIFTVNIPFIPPMPISTIVRGEFRCERGGT